MARNLAVLSLLALLCACGSQPAADTPAGVAAVVDGRVVALRQLEYQYDLVMLGSMADNATVSRLASGYGAALAGLIVQELALRDLEKAGHPVTDAEVEAGLAALRRDYPGDAFEKMLAEEAIEPDLLRSRLRGRLAVEKLAALVLRPSVKITPQEAADYYRSHAADFGKPAKLRLLVVRGATKDEARKAADAAKAQNAGQAQGLEIVSSEDNLAPEWREALKKIKPGETSAPIADKPGFVALTLVERIAAKPADPVQAYPRVEAELLGAKMRDAFAAWLDNAVSKAVITVNPGISLAADKPAEETAAQPEQEPASAAQARDAAGPGADEDKSSEELAKDSAAPQQAR